MWALKHHLHIAPMERIYHPIGNELKMGLGLDWTANRFALFNYSANDAGDKRLCRFQLVSLYINRIIRKKKTINTILIHQYFYSKHLNTL